MSDSARVHSLDALKDFRTALCAFATDAQKALDGARTDIRRALDGLDDRLAYWRNQVRERGEELTRAKTALVQRRWGHRDGQGPGTTEAEIAVKAAQRKLQEAEEKIKTVQRWQRHLPREINDYEGPARMLAGYLDADLKRALVLLDRMTAALEAYVTLAPPTSTSASRGRQPPEAPAETDGVAPGASAPGSPGDAS